jgi:dihydrodipicolinate synthase/N-acetylneuraminate lyase
VAGACGETRQAVAEAEIARGLGYHAALVNLGGPLKDASDDRLIEHLEELARVLPIFGFYLQPAAGGRELPYRFWRRFAEEVSGLVAIKIAAFNRYQTLEVIRAVADSGRAGAIAIYTGNDDAIVLDLLSEFELGGGRPLRIVGGLLGQWAIGTRRAVELLEESHRAAERRERYPADLLKLSGQVTDLNAAVFDPANGFRGCIPGINEVLRRQRLLRGRWCLDPRLDLSPGQAEEIDRVLRAYPHLVDELYIEENLSRWQGS